MFRGHSEILLWKLSDTRGQKWGLIVPVTPVCQAQPSKIQPYDNNTLLIRQFECYSDAQSVPTHRVTVLLGSKPGSGSSVSSPLLQLTLIPTAWTLCSLGRSSAQLQPLVEASSPGQAWLSLGNRSSISTRRPSSRGMPTPGANIVLRLDLTSAAPQPPIIPYLHHGAFSGCNVDEKKVVITTIIIIKSAFRPWMNGKVKGSAQQWTLAIRSFQKYSAPLIFSPSVPLCHGSPGAQLPLVQTLLINPRDVSPSKRPQQLEKKRSNMSLKSWWLC